VSLLTEATVRSLKYDGKQRTVFDPSLAGFGVRINQTSKTFVLVAGKNRQRTTIGRYGIITLAEARTKAKKILAEKTLGNTKRPTLTFEAALTLFKSTHCAEIRPRTAYDYDLVLTKHFLPKLRLERLEDITKHQLANITDRLIDRPSARRHALAVSRTFFKWAARRGYLEHSPTDGVQLPGTIARDRVLTDQELKAVWLAANRPEPFHHIVRLCILTGQRRGEIAKIQGEYVKDGRLNLPASITKNARAHSIPLGPMALELFSALPKEGYIFGRPFNNWSNGKRFLKCDVENWTPHDLRRTFATNLAELGVAPHVIERLLNHVTGTISGVAAIYNRNKYEKETREAVELWEHKLQELIS
jgi:integrase